MQLFKRCVCMLVMALPLASFASAGTIGAELLVGNSPQQPGQYEVVFNNVTDPAGNPVVGRLNNNPVNTLVYFDSKDLLTADANGQAKVRAVDGEFVDMMFGLGGAGFRSAVFDLGVFDFYGGIAGTVDFTVSVLNGPHTTFKDLHLNENGNNFFTIAALNGNLIDSISLVSDWSKGNKRTPGSGATFAQISHVRIGLPNSDQPGAVPEPGTYALLGCGLLGLGAVRKLRARRT
jgi:hypothetical protein